MASVFISWILEAARVFISWILKAASVFISSILNATTDWLSLIRNTTIVADDFKRTLERIKAVLVDAEKREIIDESVKLWLKEIKDVAYDAEDLLDEYQYEVLRAQVENHVEGEEEVMPLSSSASSKISIPRSMANRIKKVRERLDDISKDRHNLHLKPEDGQRRRVSSSEYPPPTSHMIIEQEIYGRDHEKEKLIDWLLSDEGSKFEVLAVVGKGGLGKTTVAQLVYNDMKVKDYFEQRMWICVSDDFNLIRLTRAMIESITKNACTLSDQLSLLQEYLHKELQGRRVLLVLDDIWNENKDLWRSLSIPLHGADIIRILVTARNDSVAEIMQTTSPYRLGYLPEEQCWQLFMRLAFLGRAPQQFPSLVNIGKKIVKKCDGLPLAVKSLGGLLQHETDEDKWNEVLHSKLWANKTDILPALMLSYIRMPSHLKPCFEICSIFPKDYEFNKDELVNLWAAHGYIEHNNGEKTAVEKIGCTYFNELHRRSFFDESNKYGKYVYRRRMRFKRGKTFYKMHGNIHDLAHYVQVGMDLSNHKIRHLSTTNKSMKYHVDDIGALRTLIISRGKMAMSDMLGRNITRLTHLRYLSIESYLFREEFLPLLLDGLRNLICLRHLELDSAENMKVTKSIGHLYNLVLLKITCYGHVEIPETLRNLVSLTTIHFRGFHNEQLPALGQLPSLKFLTLTELNNVKRIGNEFYRGGNDRRGVAFPSLISLVFEELTNWEKWDELQKGDFPQLQKLEINCCERLASLPSLQNLDLLLHMSIRDCSSLQFWQVPPNLKTLENSDQLNFSLPQGLGELKKLKRLTGTFQVGIDDALGILKNLAGLKHLLLWNANRKYISFEEQEEVLHLLVESGSKDAIFSLVQNLLSETSTNLVSFTTIHFGGFRNDQLPALGQLPSLKSLTLIELDNVKSVGNEFCRGRNNRHRVAFPSLISLVFENMSNWEKWDELQVGDFPRLQNLEINHCRKLSSLSLGNLVLLWHMSLKECASLMLLTVGSLPPNLKTLQNSPHLELSLPQGFRELKKLERLTGFFGVRIDEVSGILKNLASLHYLILSNLWNAHRGGNDEACLKECCSIKKLVLNWFPPSQFKSYFDKDKDLHLVVERYQNYETVDESFHVLERLQPHTNLEELYIIGYEAVGYPSWISRPSFDRLHEVRLRRCKIDRLPTLGQLPSLKRLHLHSVYCLKRIGSEFCRGVNNEHSHDAVAFPSLIELVFEDMDSWVEWDGVRRGDFPKLEDLSVRDCPRLSSLYSCSAKRLQLKNFKVKLRVRNYELFETLNSLPEDTTKLTITALGNVRNAMEAKADLFEGPPEFWSLTLRWSTDDDDANITSLRLVVEDDEDDDDDGTNQIENASFFVLEKLQPQENLFVLNIEGYDGVGYPIWIGHPSFHRLTYVNLCDCKNDQLPTLGQLPSLVRLNIDSILGLKKIGDEFCRGGMMMMMTMNKDHDKIKVAFQSLINLQFKHMHDWEEWYGVLDGDFSRLEKLVIEDCPSLPKDLDSFPRKLLKYMYK